MKKAFRIIFKTLLTIVIIVVILAGVFLAYAGITTYHPDDVEVITPEGKSSKEVSVGDDINIMTWNIGYLGLDEEADFFMDGGKMVRSKSKENVIKNGNGISEKILAENPDILLLQEVDISAKRSYYVDEQAMFNEIIRKEAYMSSFAINYRAGYVPYPFPKTIGRVEAGVLSYSKYKVNAASRIQLPIPFSWPVSMLNLKRCLLVNRIPIKGSDKELVMINLHLEAYDDGAGKIEQTKVLKNIMEEEYKKGNYVIAGGDFNQTFSNIDSSKYPYHEGLWKQGAIDAKDFDGWQLIMDNKTPTCRSLDKPYKGEDKANFQYYMIDGFMVSANVNVKNVETKNYDFLYTDHNPVVLKVSLK